MASISLVGATEPAASFYVELLSGGGATTGATGYTNPDYYDLFTDSSGAPLYDGSGSQPTGGSPTGSSYYASAQTTVDKDILTDEPLFSIAQIAEYLRYKTVKNLAIRVTARGANGNDIHQEVITRDELFVASPVQSACPGSLLAADLETDDYQRTESYTMASGEILVPSF